MDLSTKSPVRPAVPTITATPPNSSTIMPAPLAATGSSEIVSIVQSGSEQDPNSIIVDAEIGNDGLGGSSSSAPTQFLSTLARRPTFSSELIPRTLQGKVVYKTKTQGVTKYGKGAWSVVYQGVYEKSPDMTRSKSGLPSPPGSPSSVAGQFVAVKEPLPSQLGDTKSVVLKEAQILTYIQPFPFVDPRKTFQEHVVTFLGFKPEDTAIVMEALPLTLSAFSLTRGKTAVQQRETISSLTKHEPVVGAEQWLVLASKLIAGLEFLQELKIVHGDIKPQNILLRRRKAGSSDVIGDVNALLEPVYCDFSSAHVVQDGNEPEPVSAITYTYTAPELLEAHRRSGEDNKPIHPISTYRSDVFALGATLLVPAIGQELYSQTSSTQQKLAMVRQGQPLEGARCTDQAVRVMRGGLVDRAVRGAVAKKLEDRWNLDTWKAVVEGEMRKLKEEVAQ
ncbi:MAG: hypothetical protein M1816_007732 [Peltula sp. TS41687]|nr:MAG: hypothetical protein M1816_007732 [Peltula sp. TS41687]